MGIEQRVVEELGPDLGGVVVEPAAGFLRQQPACPPGRPALAAVWSPVTRSEARAAAGTGERLRQRQDRA